MNIHRMKGMLLVAVLTAFAWSALPGQADAGSLDRALLDKSPDILAHLKRKKITTVGILPFRVQVGDRKAAYAGAPLGVNLPTRLENALIMAMEPNEAHAIGILHQAARTAARSGVGSYTTSEADFKKLFSLKYDLAWGGKTAQPRGFLSGTVTNTGATRRTTQVKIDLFTPSSFKNGKLSPDMSWTLSAPTDTALAADLGYNFALSRNALSRSVRPARRDQAVTQQIAQFDQTGRQQTSQLTSSVPTPENIAGFAFELRYDGVKQELKGMTEGQGAQAPIYTAPPARAGSKISMYLTRLDESSRKLGALLLVNGKSSFSMEEGEVYNLRKWIYEPTKRGMADEFLGFYTGTEGNNLLPFKVLTPEESLSKASELGTRAGWIDIFVFASSSEQQPPLQEDEQNMLVSTRSAPRLKGSRQSLAQLRSALLKANNVRERKGLVNKRNEGGLILHEMEPVPGGLLTTDQFPNPVLLGHLSIRYWEGPTKKIQTAN